MPAVFVHGNPETDAIWVSLFEALQRTDVIALSPPGFGAPVPAGWTATRREYIDWLTEELAHLEGDIDLVGHDWGGGHVLGYLAEHPQAVRSWCVDLLGICHPDYVWHDTAQIWQTAGAGEQHVAGMLAAPKADLVTLYQTLGMTPTAAASAVDSINDDMAACILGLYRDAAQPALAEWGRSIDVIGARPGLAINAEHDHYVGTDAMIHAMAERTGARVAHLAGVGHWWMCQDPANGATTLETFWAGIP